MELIEDVPSLQVLDLFESFPEVKEKTLISIISLSLPNRLFSF